MLDSAMKQQLSAYLDNLKTPVELVAFTDQGAKSQELLGLVNDIASLSDKVTATQGDDANERAPTMLVRSVANGTEIRFAGIPMGHEFTSLVLALLHSGGHPMKVEPELIEQVRNLDGEYHFETFVSLSCQTCPEVVQSLNMMAAINPNIKHTMVDGSLFQDEVTERDVMAVPTAFLNGEVFSQGRLGLADMLKKLDKNAAANEAKAIDEKAPFDMLIVGGGPAGASSAIYGARKGIRVGIVAEDFGGQLLDTLSIENFISVKETEGPKLTAHLEEHVKSYDVDIMAGQRVAKVIPAAQVGGLITLELDSGATVQSRTVILATGARWRELGVPGEREYRGKGVAYCAHCDGPLFKGKKVAVVGGGNSGIEAAIDLSGLVEHVTVLEFADTLRADEVLQDKANSIENIEIVKSALTTEIPGTDNKVTGLTYQDRNTDEQHQVDVSGVFVQIGLVPNTEFLQDTIDLNGHGEIITNAQGETSASGIFAAGDVTEAPFKQIIVAMGSGATAALGAFDYLIRTPSVEETQAAA